MNLEISKCQMFGKYSQDKEFSRSLKDFVVTFVETWIKRARVLMGCISISPQPLDPFKLAYSWARIWIKSSETLSKDAITFLLSKHA